MGGGGSSLDWACACLHSTWIYLPLAGTSRVVKYSCRDSELDNTTFSTYYTYALSDFNTISVSSSLSVVYDLIFALLKPFWAKTSDIYGRGEMYPAALLLITIGLVTSASATSFAAIAAGTFVRILGMTCINSMNDVIIIDFTTTRQRGLGVSFQFWPYIILPWVSGYMWVVSKRHTDIFVTDILIIKYRLSDGERGHRLALGHRHRRHLLPHRRVRYHGYHAYLPAPRQKARVSNYDI